MAECLDAHGSPALSGSPGGIRCWRATTIGAAEAAHLARSWTDSRGTGESRESSEGIQDHHGDSSVAPGGNPANSDFCQQAWTGPHKDQGPVGTFGAVGA